jgi:intracellular septation protein A
MVQNVQTLLFHEGHEKYFMDDKHVEQGHPNYTALTRKQVDELEQQLKAFKNTWPTVNIVTQQYFSAKAQDRIEDYMMLKEIEKDIWVQPWEQLIEILKMMYPETIIAKRDAMAKAKVEIINFLMKNIHTTDAWYVWTETAIRPIMEQELTLLTAVRSILIECQIPRDQHKEVMAGRTGIGPECVKAFVNKLRSVNSKWVDSLNIEIRIKMDKIKPNPLTISELQAVVGRRSRITKRCD